MDIPHAYYDLVFSEHGTVTLEHDNEKIWSSDTDEDFMEEFDGDTFFDGEDADDIIDYLMDIELLTEEDEIDIVEHDLEDYEH